MQTVKLKTVYLFEAAAKISTANSFLLNYITISRKQENLKIWVPLTIIYEENPTSVHFEKHDKSTSYHSGF